MNISLTLTQKQIDELIITYASQKSSRELPYVSAQLILSDCTITIYTSKKVVFQGDGASFYAGIYTTKFKAQAGSDEVGTGDVFGPVVVAACFVSEAHYETLKVYPIQDSKKMTDAMILQIGPILMSTLPHSLLILTNQKYNEVHESDNMNAIKAKLHNQAYVHLNNKIDLSKHSTLNVVDQFTPKTNYFNYLQGQSKIFKELHFETKAESKYFAVACASVIARTAFLKELEAMGSKYKTVFPKGASNLVDAFASDFLAQHGISTLKKVAKLHFKNLKPLIDLQDD
jgi:ribonuclease HIII